MVFLILAGAGALSAQDSPGMAGTIPGSEQLPDPEKPRAALAPTNEGATDNATAPGGPLTPAPGDFAKRQFGSFTDDEAAAGRGEQPRVPDGKPLPTIDQGLWNLLYGLIALLVVFGLVVWWLRRNPVTRRYFGGGPVRVLSRAYLAPRQAVYLVKVGERVILIGAGGEGLRTLLEVSDPAEVSRLMAQIEESNPQSMTSTFRQALATAEGGKPKPPTTEHPTASRRVSAEPASSPSSAGAEDSEGAIRVDPGYSAKLKLAAMRTQMERNKAGT